MQQPFNFGIDKLTISTALGIARGQVKGIINDEARLKIKASYQQVDDIVAQKQVVYGINTGFGPLCDTLISAEETTQLQHNLLMSHSVGVGKVIDPELSKLMLILKLQDRKSTRLNSSHV